MSGPALSIEVPRGAPAECGALEQVRALARAPGFRGAEVRVDGSVVPHSVRLLPEQASISAWCDTRGLPPGLHEIVVTARWEDGEEDSAAVLVTVTVGEPMTRWPAPPIDLPLSPTVRIGDPGLPDALAAAADATPLILLDDNCTPTAGTLERLAAAFAGPGRPEVIIGDEAAALSDGRWLRWRKLAFQPERLPWLDHVGPLLAVGPRAAAVLHAARPPATVYDHALELLDHGLPSISLPHVLATTPVARLPEDGPAQRAAVERLAQRRRRPVEVADGPEAGLRTVRWPLAAAPEIVAVVPSRTPALAEGCLAALARHTGYPRLRVVLVDSSPDAEEMERVVAGAPLATTRLRYPAGEEFNYQRAVNAGAREARGAHVLFLNDDVRALRPGWLSEMAELLTLPGVGIVGAFLLLPDGRIQHAGVQIGSGTGHLYHDAPGDARGHRLELLVPANPEAVTGACMLARAEVLEQLGGHDERYVHVYGDVDLCLRAGRAGWRIAFCASARLEHQESASYAGDVAPSDVERFTLAYQGQHDPGQSHTVPT